MPPISETIQQFQRLRQRHAAPAVADRLHDLTGFAPDPGNLRARLYVPATLRPGAALVVALHGCTQDAAGYDHGTGWSTLADREGFAVLFPEQRRANNANLCFNWFEDADIARIGGEAESIVAMIDAVVAQHAIDPARVFVTGLSAGGAMTAVLLATWPERFAAGAIIGGLPYGTAIGVRAALERMRGQPAAAPRAIAPAAAMPRIAIWHGTADPTVVVANSDALVDQWRTVHALPTEPTERTGAANWSRRAWQDAAGRTLVEEWRIAGMGHGVPIDSHGGIGAAGPFMLDVGLSSTLEIARGWGLTGTAAPAVDANPRLERITPAASARPAAPTPASGVQATIEKALRSAGLLR
ncbi:PHB depolymerase family esterase [Sphingomonas sp. 2R-10]|uniref:extracellular catalytic domain type 1 short-chain-length polyhydroxyalkanoate depolymerase n=1 Tax=Sphingomonas sp. 2R-10 TaxID=3045148 RepID=UPI000F77EB55|nr:PHB depolymerase family esterase [Sphingomonas sp. 2R-10]MDJ0278459.1 PHB depolymerase family esterase [Sphingomonas sp. 2R-10]